MARPTKDAVQRRDIIVRVRLTVAEKQRMQTAAEIAGLNLSDLLRVRTLDSLPHRRKPSPERAAFIRGLADLGKMGSNLNQIAHACNRRQADLDIVPLPEQMVAHALEGVDSLSHRLLNMLEHGY